MKVIIKCSCGNQVELNPETMGNVSYVTQVLVNNDFYYDEKINTELQQGVVSDPDDVDTKLEELRFNCRKCDEFIVLSF